MVKKMKRWMCLHLPTRRRLIQLYAALLYNAHVKGFVSGGIFTGLSKAACVPGLNCYSCPGAIGACPLGALQNALASTGSRTPAYVLGILLLYGVIFGRTICGFLCPVGLMQELLHKLPTPKAKKGRITRAFSWLKYALLVFLVILMPLWYAIKGLPLPAFCKYICPAGTLEGAVALLAHPDNGNLFFQLGGLFTSKAVILIVILALCVFIYRAFCRFFCPLGAIYGLFARVAVIGVKVDVKRCVDCGACMACCPMDIRHVGDHECIHCTACINACPTNAISLRAGKIVLKENVGVSQPPPQVRRARRRGHMLATVLSLLLLSGALFYANWPAAPKADVPTGSEAGMRAADFSIPAYDGARWTLADQRGKVVVLNFWATWCGPCVKELPCFEALALAFPDEVAVVAIHSDLVTEDVPAWLASNAFQLPFAWDEDGSVIRSFGGSTMLPHTVIIDQTGVIVYNQVGSLDTPTLESLVIPLLGR